MKQFKKFNLVLGCAVLFFSGCFDSSGTSFTHGVSSLAQSNSSVSPASAPSPTSINLGTSAVLPIEITYPVGSSKTVVLNTNAAASSLNLSLHGMELENQVSVQINNSPAVLLNNSNVKISGPGLARFFPIGSSDNSYYNLSLPITAPAGNVSIKFTLNLISDRLSEFRVVKIGLTSSSGANVVTNAFQNENPSLWSAPAVAGKPATSADVTSGQALFTQVPLINSPLNKTKMAMHCSDCHASDGSDLKYFNYSNTSIIARALFHGMTQTQGQQIAAYIRTLDTYQSINGRPWQPPYQPAPGLDDRAAVEWSAGGGIDSVLNNDSDMLQYLIPAYASKGAAAITPDVFLNPANPNSRGSLRMFSSINVRTMPQAMPFPDWNHWLTPLSIRDLAGTDDNYENSFLVTQFNTTLQAAQAIQAENLNDGGYKLGTSVQNNWQHEIYGPNAYGHPFLPASIYPPAGYTSNQLIKANYDLRLWTMVKSWQLQHEFALDDKTHAVYDPELVSTQKQGQQSTNSDVGDLIEPRGWVFTGASFLTSPHGIDPTNLITNTYMGDIFIHESWYYMQLILNPGMGLAGGNFNIDFGYFTGTTLGSDGARSNFYTSPTIPAGTSTATLAYPFNEIMPFPVVKDMLLTLKAWSERDGGMSVTSAGDLGWSPVRLAHDISYSQNPAGTSLNDTVPADLPLGTSQALIEAMMHAWLMKSKSFSNQDYYTGYSTLSTDTPNLNKFYTAQVNASSVITSAANYADVCNYNAAVWTVGDQICPFSRISGYFPSALVAGPTMNNGAATIIPSLVTWRGGVLQNSSKEIINWAEQLFPKVDFYGLANQAVSFCQTDQSLVNESYSCLGEGSSLAKAISK